MKFWITLALLAGFCSLSAQTTVGLVAYYPFDTSLVDATGNSANTGAAVGNPTYLCGVNKSAIALDGFDDQVVFLGPVNNEFDTEDITISFYFKSTGAGGTQYLLSKRSDVCDDEKIFYIRYAPVSRTVNVLMSENSSKRISMIHQIDNTTCWQHLVLVRGGNRVSLYINGNLAQELATTSRVDILNNGELTLGGAECRGVNETNFDGLIDDLRIYNRALNERDVQGLYIAPDNILNRDTLIYLGNSVDIRLSNTCAENFSWSPVEGVSAPFTSQPVITPTMAGVILYTLSMSENVSGCTARDSLRITVIDPDDLDCNAVFLPKAFTPNDDGINDTYGISNPFAIQELISFEIFDRWGSRVFYSESPFEKWDGTFKGELVNPGVLLYKVHYRCEGQEKLEAGSLTLLR